MLKIADSASSSVPGAYSFATGLRNPHCDEKGRRKGAQKAETGMRGKKMEAKKCFL